ncbi:MAG: efflux RND transporter permease subunit [Bifidobacteriaceae bacterium]|nr:efflux RND transporter permease subunit [Bifidobacteriaceae bacterium]
MFRLARLSLRNRAVVALATIAIVIGGVFSLGSLKQELIPSMEIPMAAVIATYPGASAAIVEDAIATPVESAIRSVAGVESVQTTSMNSVAIGMVEFSYGTDMDVTNQKLSTAVTRLAPDLPEGAETQVWAGSLDDFPVIQLAVSASGTGPDSRGELAQAVDQILVPRLGQLPGVRSVDVSGYEAQQIDIDLDAQAMAAAGVSASAVADVLKNNGLAFPAGAVSAEGGRTLTAQIGSPLTSVEELASLPLVTMSDAADSASAAPAGQGATAAPGDGAGPGDPAASGNTGAPAASGDTGGQGDAAAGGADLGELAASGDTGDPAASGGAGGQDDLASLVAPPAPVTLGDVASVTLGTAAADSYARMDGRDAVAIAVTKTPDANTVEVSHAVTDQVDELAEALAEGGLTVDVAFDQAPFIEDSVAGLAEEGLLGLVFAVIVILVFLVSLRSTLVSAVSIPLSLLVAFITMRVTGETLNMLTLAALTISIGRVVDDSIVVIENIKRHLTYGEPKAAAIIGAVKEVGGAIAASTVSTAAVFLPMAFVGGMVGELFRPFSLTFTIALLASLLVALTIVPVLAYWFVKTPVAVDAEYRARVRAEAEAKERRGLWQRAYLPTLRGALAHPVITLAAAVVLLGGTLGLTLRLDTNFLGDMGQDTMTVTETFEPATSLDVQDADARRIEAALLDLPEVGQVQTTVGGGGMMGMGMLSSSPQASFAITLASDADPAAAEAHVREAVAGLGGEASTGLSVGGSEAMMGTSTIDLIVQGTDSELIDQAARMVDEKARTVEGAVEVSNNLTDATPAVQITVDRSAAAALGLTETAVEAMVAGLMTPSTIGSLEIDGAQVDVKLALGPGAADLAELRALPLGAGPAGVLTLEQLASVQEVTVPTALTRVDGRRSATVSVTPESQDLGGLSGRLTEAVDQLDLPPGVTVEVGGVAAQQNEAFADLGLALVLAIAIVFIVMVATFGSLLQPFILLISIPFAATGALAALLVSGTPLGVASLIGVLMLVGIVVSNAIVLIDLINQYRRRGRALDDSIIEGSRKRLRPIVMTALATICALTPMALGITGQVGFLSQPLALVVIGGLVSSTLLTLVVVPVLYRFEARAHDRREARRDARMAARRAELQSALDAAASGPGPGPEN